MAQAPAITSLSPQAVKPGVATDMKVRGGNLAGSTQLWSTLAPEVPLTPDLAGNNTNAAEVSYRFTVPADAGPGVYGLRLAGPGGISNLRMFVVDDLPTLAQVKPNQALANAQVVALPAGVDGQVDNLQRDYYKFTAAAGQKLSIEVLAQRIGSSLDPLVKLMDANGREIAYADDTPGVGSDCQLIHTFAAAGDYLLEVRDVRYQGGGNHFYRLRVGDFPCVNTPFPLAVKRGASANIQFAGIGVADVPAVPLTLPADYPHPTVSVGAKIAGGTSSGWGLVTVSDLDEFVETEPNDAAEQGQKVALPQGLNGRFDKAGDIDRFTFTATKGQRWLFEGITRTVGSPADLMLKIVNAQGGDVVVIDDTGTDEGIVDFNVPADGDYTLVVEDLHKRGGTDLAYRVAVRPFADKLKLVALADTLNVQAGGLLAVQVNAVRGPFAGPITLALEGAPDGMVATPVVMGPGRNSVTMTIACAATVPAGKVYGLRIVGTTALNGQEVKSVASVTDVYKGVLGGNPFPPAWLEGRAFAGVAPAPLFTLANSAPEIIFGKDLSATVKIVATRKADFAEDIALAIQPAQDGVPAGITPALKPIAKGTNEIEISFAANNGAPLGQFSVVLVGTGKAGNVTSVQPIPALLLSLKAPFELKTEIPDGKIAKGQTVKVKVTAVRNPAYAGPINLAFQNLPAGITPMAGAMIPAGQNEVLVDLVAAADAAAANVPNVIVQGEGMNGAAKLVAPAPAVALVVE
jgi:hypothetical protein